MYDRPPRVARRLCRGGRPRITIITFIGPHRRGRRADFSLAQPPMHSPSGLRPHARGEPAEVRVRSGHLQRWAPRGTGGVGPSSQSFRARQAPLRRRWESKSTAECNESVPAPSKHQQGSGSEALAKLGSRQSVGPQNERRTPSNSQELLDSALWLGRREPVQLAARVGTNAASGAHVG